MAMSIALSGCAHGDARKPYGPVTVTTTGGVGGVSERLSIEVDGTALLLGNQPVGGKMRPAYLAELRRLLTGKQIQREAGNSDRNSSDRCTDGFTRTLWMGQLRVSRYFCSEPIKAPVFERALELTSPDRLESLPPLPAAPPLRALTVIDTGATDSAGARYEVTPAGVMTVRHPGQPRRPNQLQPGQLDALRLLLTQPVQVGFDGDCPGQRTYLVSVAGPQPVSAVHCAGKRLQYPELAAVVRILLDAAGEG